MISPLQNLKQTHAQCVKLRSWIEKTPETWAEELLEQVDDIMTAVEAAIVIQGEGVK